MKARNVLIDGRDSGMVAFKCPGCGYEHMIPVRPQNYPTPVWGFNGDLDKPTFTRSINVKTGKFVDPNWIEPNEPGTWSTICHSFVRDGKIQFLHDCTHALKGRELDLPNL